MCDVILAASIRTAAAVPGGRGRPPRSCGHSGQAPTDALPELHSRLGEANYVFAGPGSPTYALRHWRGNGVRERLAEKLMRGGCVAFASAAAIGLGAYALPVYEIYKVGDDPSWTAGLVLLSEVGVRCAVVRDEEAA